MLHLRQDVHLAVVVAAAAEVVVVVVVVPGDAVMRVDT